MIHNALFYNREPPSRTPEKRLDCHRITLCTIAAQTPPTRFAISIILIRIVAGKKTTKSPTTRLRCRPCIVLRPMPAAGASASLHYTSGATLRFATFRSIPFIVSPSLGNPRKSVSFIPLRSCQPAVSFRSPLAFQPTTRNSKPKREATFHPSQFATLHSVTTLAFPHANQRYALRRVCPGKQKPQIPHRPLMVAGKNKGAFAHGLCACSRFVSLIQPFALTLVPRVAAHYFISFTSPASAPHV